MFDRLVDALPWTTTRSNEYYSELMNFKQSKLLMYFLHFFKTLYEVYIGHNIVTAKNFNC